MKQAFIQTIEKHQGIIFKVARMYRDKPQDQEDLYQDIVLQLWKAYPNFKKEAKVSTWMYRIALNTAMAVFRSRKIDLEFRETPPESRLIADSVSDDEAQLFVALRTLNKADRSIVALYLEGYAYREIAEIIGITEAYVAVKISRIKEQLKQINNSGE